MTLPCIALTMGDAAGIGPELVVRACLDAEVLAVCRPVVVGNAAVLQRAAELIGVDVQLVPFSDWNDVPTGGRTIPCCDPGPSEVTAVQPATIDPRAGRAAYNYLVTAAEAARLGHVAALTTAPLNKAALNQAGLQYPGHTEILAELCGVEQFAMLLHLPCGPGVASPHGLSVAHVTLHTSLASVPEQITCKRVGETINLLNRFLPKIGCQEPRIGVCALNPHAGEEGLFGDEESHVIAPAVAAARETGIDVAGPIPADTLLQRASRGEFDGVAAMYHDQGHIALKLLGFERAVNVTLGLPIVRTSPAQGTAFDIAWRGEARVDGMRAAVKLAARLGLESQIRSQETGDW